MRPFGWIAIAVSAFLGSACVLDGDDDRGTLEVEGRSSCRTALPSSIGQSWRWGGGYQYPDLIRPASCSVLHVNQQAADAAGLSLEGLLRLDVETQGALVYVDPDVEIEITATLDLAAGVTLASNRGDVVNGIAAPGAKLYTTFFGGGVPILQTTRNNVRITGLRVWGPDTDICPPGCYGTGQGPHDKNTCIEDGTTDVVCATSPNDGIHIENRNVEVDNNDIAGFTAYGVAVWGVGDDTIRPYIHHNYVHHCQRRGRGYLVLVDGPDNSAAAADIEWNRFQNYRHAIASSGYRDQDYYARWNWVGEKNIGKFKDVLPTGSYPVESGRAFDVHPEFDRTCRKLVGDQKVNCLPTWHSTKIGCHDDLDPNNDCHACQYIVNGSSCSLPEYAGGRMEVTGNIFRSGPPDDADNYSFDVRGKPQEGAHFYGNCTARGGSTSIWPNGGLDVAPEGSACEGTRAVCQREFGYGNVWTDRDPATSGAAWNTYSAGPDGCASSPYNAPTRWCISSQGRSPWRYLNTSTYGINEIALGDFDGDGTTDVFRVFGSSWLVSFGGTGTWVPVKSGMSAPLADLRFGNFDAGSTTDVFLVSNGSFYYVAGAGNTTWGALQPLTAPLRPIGDLALGKFEYGDSKTDLLYADGTNWYVARNGTGTWNQVKASAVRANEMGVADVDGTLNGDTDGLTDIVWYRASDGRLRFWSPATRVDIARERTYALSGPRADKLHFGKIVSTVRNDALYANGERWFVMTYTGSGTAPWASHAIASEYYTEIKLGTFDGDAYADVLFPDCQ